MLATDASTVVRRGVVTDAAALAEFAARTFADTFAKDNRPEDMAVYLASAYGIPQQAGELADPGVVTLLAHRDGVLVGYAQIRRKAPPECVTHLESMELRRFYVDRSVHGSGIAAVLMREVHAVVAELGGRHVWLGVWERNARAIAFYCKWGFTRVGSHDFIVGTDRQTDDVFVAPARDDFDGAAHDRSSRKAPPHDS